MAFEGDIHDDLEYPEAGQGDVTKRFLRSSHIVSPFRSALHKTVPLMNEALFGDSKDRHDHNTMEYWDWYINKHNTVITDTKIKSPLVRVRVIEWPSEGRVLRGRLYEPRDSCKNKRNILVITYSGSAGSSEEQMRDISVEYVHLGCKVLSLDYRGFGASTSCKYKKGSRREKFNAGGLGKLHAVHLLQDGLEFYNCATTLIRNYNNKFYRPSQIVIHGYSLGGPIAAYTASKAARKGEKIKALVLDRIMPSMQEGVVEHGFPVWGGKLVKYTHGSLNTGDVLSELRKTYGEIVLLIIAAGSQDPMSKSDSRLGLFAQLLGFNNVRREVVLNAGHFDNEIVFNAVRKTLHNVVKAKNTQQLRRFSNRHNLSAWCGIQRTRYKSHHRSTTDIKSMYDATRSSRQASTCPTGRSATIF